MGFLGRKGIWIAIGLPILIVAWLAFRPEKLWINQRVNEPAPFASRSEAWPIFAGRLEGRAHPTSGRATLYESLGGKRYLRLTDFTTSNGPDVHVVLSRAEDPALDQKIVKGNLDYVELGKPLPQARLSMRKLKEVLRLHSLGLKQRQIVRSCLIAQSTVRTQGPLFRQSLLPYLVASEAQGRLLLQTALIRHPKGVPCARGWPKTVLP